MDLDEKKTHYLALCHAMQSGVRMEKDGMAEAFDDYGNKITDGEYETDGRPIYCVFPDCGCDGERLCMAVNGASDRACRQNVEGMYRRTDKRAVWAHSFLGSR